MPDEARPHCANYTVADYFVRDTADDPVGVMDIDVVLHPDDDGEFSAPVADWAVNAEPGSPVAFLDQGVLFLPPEDADQYIVAVDDTGLPAARQIAHDLPADASGTMLVEVATSRDVEAWDAPAGLTVEWLVRETLEDGSPLPGALALERLRELVAASPVSPLAYGFAVGESSLATGARRALVKAGLDKKRITFSGFWKHGEQRG